MSIKIASPIPYRSDSFSPPMRIAPAVNPPPLASVKSERIPPACETCAGFRALTDRFVELRQKITERDSEFQKISQKKTELLGTVAHDLRLPLATIRTCSELLVEDAEGRTSAGQRELIDSIHSVSAFMLRLLDDTLDLASVESGTVQLHPAPAILSEIVARSVSLSFPLAARKRMGLNLVQDGEPRPLLLDAIKICKVFNNLLENAIRYCQPGARIEVRISRGADTVVVSVKDDGPGIDLADLKTLFTPFQRTRARALSEEPSAGLGLAIAKRIMDLHGGRIWVKSEVGRGTTFFVSLPIQIRPAAKRS